MNLNQRRKVEGFAFLAAFGLCIPAANWLISNVGTDCLPTGPCLIPVAPGISAPSGVTMVGMALVFRDLVQRRLGRNWALVAIFAGTALSAFVSPSSLVIASGTAFFLSELADFAVYTPLQHRGFILAVAASSVIGSVVDSVVFLWLAFGDLSFLPGQVIGKTWMVIIALPLLYWLRSRDRRIGLQPV